MYLLSWLLHNISVQVKDPHVRRSLNAACLSAQRVGPELIRMDSASPHLFKLQVLLLM